MTSRRFDTRVVLQQLIDGDARAFDSFYERYRGRVYRFIVRQCGAGPHNHGIYMRIWAGLAEVRKQCSTPGALKLRFYQLLHRCVSDERGHGGEAFLGTTPGLMAMDNKRKWGVLLIDLLRELPDEQREAFLLRNELGLKVASIAQIVGEATVMIEGRIRKVRHELQNGLIAAGCPHDFPFKRIYSETRILKPPSAWDQQVRESIGSWLSGDVPQEYQLDPARSLRNMLTGAGLKSLSGSIRQRLGGFSHTHHPERLAS